MFKKVILMFLLVFTFVFFFDEVALAVNYEYYVTYSQPTCNDKSGYFSVISSANDGSLYTYFWTFTGLNESNGSAEMVINVTSSKTVEFTPVIYPIGSSAWCTFGYYDQNGILHMTRYGLVSGNTNTITETFTYDIAGFCFGGNVMGFSNGYRDVPTPIIHWNESADGVELNNKMNEILTRLANLDTDTDVMVNYLVNIYNQNIAIQEKLDLMNSLLNQLIAEQEESNSWLEKIFEAIKGQPEEEKNAAQSQGNQSTSDATNAIQDNSAGFKDAITGLTSSMSYAGTECKWTFPQVKLPAIDGVMEERVLISERDIDFGYWVNQIPSGILLLIQSVLSVGLIIYCFKELYDTISYVLTLRGGGNSE